VHKGRLEAFSDGVLAIIITIMVLEMKPPRDGPAMADLRPVLPVFLSYTLSFVYVGIYWNNHHHMFQVTERVTGSILWANLHLLFWLSLTPFVTAWMGQNQFAPTPVALYGVVLLMAAVAYSRGAGRVMMVLFGTVRAPGIAQHSMRRTPCRSITAIAGMPRGLPWRKRDASSSRTSGAVTGSASSPTSPAWPGWIARP
jgi:hypothetical protein